MSENIAHGLSISPSSIRANFNAELHIGVRDDVRNALLLMKYSNTREALVKALEIEAAYKISAANWGQCKMHCGAQIKE